MRRLDPTKMSDKIRTLRKGLRERIIGQPEAIDEIVTAYQAYTAGLTDTTKPIASFLFLGPTGVGKTRTVEALAEVLVKDTRAVIKVDCAEFQHSHEIAKLIGSPPGYLGHRETHPILSQEALNQFHTEKVKVSFVLFDEIEKASDSLWNLLLGILDKATLRLGDNRKVDFSKAMVFMTSNLGSKEMGNILRPGVGFVAGQVATGEELNSRLSRAGVESARRKFTPEFINRVDHVIAFRPLGAEELEAILDIELDKVKSLMVANGIALAVGDDARVELLREGTDARYGARPLVRTIQKRLVRPLANLISTEQAKVTVGVDFEDGEWAFYNLEAEEAVAA